MSSNCSANECSSPDGSRSSTMVPRACPASLGGEGSDDLTTSSSQVGGVARASRCIVPDTKKDTKYWERRRRNNEAARRSREKRRQNDLVMDQRIGEVTQRNRQLEYELTQLKMRFGGAVGGQDSNKAMRSLGGARVVTTAPAASAATSGGVVLPLFTSMDTHPDSAGGNSCPLLLLSHGSSVATPIAAVSSSSSPSSLSAAFRSSFNNACSNSLSTCTSTTGLLTMSSHIPLLSSLEESPTLLLQGGLSLLAPPLPPPLPTNQPTSATSATSSSPAAKPTQVTSQRRSRKRDSHDILDLRVKQHIPNGYHRSLKSEPVVSNDSAAECTADEVTAHSRLTNSFLVGIVPTILPDEPPSTSPLPGPQSPPQSVPAITKLTKDFLPIVAINGDTSTTRASSFTSTAKSGDAEAISNSSVHNREPITVSTSRRWMARRQQLRSDMSVAVGTSNRQLSHSLGKLAREMADIKCLLVQILAATSTAASAAANKTCRLDSELVNHHSG